MFSFLWLSWGVSRVGPFALIRVWRWSRRRAGFRYVNWRQLRQTYWRLAPGLVATALFVAFLASSPIAGLLVFLAFPVLFFGRLIQLFSQHKKAAEESALPFLWTLLGFLRAGESLPSALFRLAESEDGVFARRIHPFLQRFHRGEGLKRCLARFCRRGDSPSIACLIQLIEVAYQRGAPLVPLLEKSLPQLEEERKWDTKCSVIRRSVLFQGAVATAIPWFLYSLAGRSPLLNGLSTPAWAVGLGLFLQGLGFGVLWRLSRLPN